MAVFVITTDAARESYEFQVPLDGKLFRMVMLFNERDSFWYMDLFDALSGDILRAGIKLVTQWDLLRLYKDDARPAGSLLTVSQGSAAVEARTLEALGNDVLLTYTGGS